MRKKLRKKLIKEGSEKLTEKWAQKMGKNLVKISWKFRLHEEVFLKRFFLDTFLENIFQENIFLIIINQWLIHFISALTAWLREHSECDHHHSLMLRVLNTLNGRCEARPIRWVDSPVWEFDQRMLTVRHNAEVDEWAGRLNKKRLFYLLFFLCFLFKCLVHLSLSPASAPMHVGDRSTWLNSEALSRDKDDFLENHEI